MWWHFCWNIFVFKELYLCYKKSARFLAEQEICSASGNVPDQWSVGETNEVTLTCKSSWTTNIHKIKQVIHILIASACHALSHGCLVPLRSLKTSCSLKSTSHEASHGPSPIRSNHSVLPRCRWCRMLAFFTGQLGPNSLLWSPAPEIIFDILRCRVEQHYNRAILALLDLESLLNFVFAWVFFSAGSRFLPLGFVKQVTVMCSQTLTEYWWKQKPKWFICSKCSCISWFSVSFALSCCLGAFIADCHCRSDLIALTPPPGYGFDESTNKLWGSNHAKMKNPLGRATFHCLASALGQWKATSYQRNRSIVSGTISSSVYKHWLIVCVTKIQE